MAHVCCVFCNNAVPPAQLRAWSGGARCPACRRITETLIFPALLEANERLLSEPALLRDAPSSAGFVAVLRPADGALAELRATALTPDAYRAAIAARDSAPQTAQ